MATLLFAPPRREGLHFDSVVHKPCSTVFGFQAGWAAAGQPPSYLPDEDEEEILEDELDATQLENLPWIDLVKTYQGGLKSKTEEKAPVPGRPAEPAPPRPAAPPRPVEDELPPANYRFQYVFHPRGQEVINELIMFKSHREKRQKLAERVVGSLAEFAVAAYGVLTSTPGGVPLLPEAERKDFMTEADTALAQQILSRRVPFSAFWRALEAFQVSKGKIGRSESSWLKDCVHHLLKAAIGAATPEEQEKWRRDARNALEDEDQSKELYATIDIRALPRVLELAGFMEEGQEVPSGVIKTADLVFRMKFQLNSGNRQQRYEGLLQAAELVSTLRLQTDMGAKEIIALFNDKEDFTEADQRKNLLLKALHTAPRSIRQQVLCMADDNVEAGEWTCDELAMVRGLIQHLNEDVRQCKNTYFRMIAEWIDDRRSGGVLSYEELSPMQILDHIHPESLDGANFEEWLRVAVNKYIKLDRKFEAARLLADPVSTKTRVYDNLRNDKQLSYLIPLYQQVQPLVDRCGPVEEDALKLPIADKDVHIVDKYGETMETLRRLTVDSETAMHIGVWWGWRCLDPRLDLWPRASFVAFQWDTYYYIVDLVELEKVTGDNGRSLLEGQRLLKDIFEALHILKIVHDVDNHALMALRRAMVPMAELQGELQPEWPVMTPVLDMGIVLAYAWQTTPRAPEAMQLQNAVYNFMRMEICRTEALSNFERRPLRKTQIHYALTMAACPLMVLRVLCVNKVVDKNDLKSLMIELIHEEARLQIDQRYRSWCELVEKLNCGKEAWQHDGTERILKGPAGEYPWTSENFLRQVRETVRPNRDYLDRIMQHLTPLKLSEESEEQALYVTDALFFSTMNRDLQTWYKATRDFKQEWF